MKKCRKCSVDKPLSEYYISRGQPMARCKKCVLQSKRQSYHEKVSHRTTKRRVKLPKNDLSGQRFGICTVLQFTSDNNENGYAEGRWLCECDCGKTFKTKGYLLTNGTQKSCGCARGGKTGSNNHNWTGFEDISGSHYAGILQHAKSRNLSVEVSIQDLWNTFIQQGKQCAISGLDLEMKDSSRRKGGRTASLDRIDSDLHYTLDNIQWIHKDLNIMKNKYKQDYFIDMCSKVYEYTKHTGP